MTTSFFSKSFKVRFQLHVQWVLYHIDSKIHSVASGANPQCQISSHQLYGFWA